MHGIFEGVEGRIEDDTIHPAQPLRMGLHHGVRGDPGTHTVAVDYQLPEINEY